MDIVSLIDIDNASQEVKDAINRHVAEGHSITNEKRTLLHNIPSFWALEGKSYELSAELKKFISPRAANLFEYAISVENDCLVCTTYYKKYMESIGVDINNVDYTEEEELVIEYAQAIVRDRKNIPLDLFDRIKARIGEEGLVVLTTMGMFMIANNYFNDILHVRSEFLE
ncbi:MAG: hypothetical protein J6I68_06045 [Butyrivibrio sp.]|uniref:hypothetical protein n=1 Tax=Butyrivibrio sp. TaxID=28121 RepID=UPI001B415141|nr:hypothetical protein [Butyrivibrio sp.]MBP3782790.1 hypothetical protein [Butyrivibrio sp.]